jgi:ankyrin repeat protein
LIAEFITAACVPLDGGHATGTLDEANAILAAHPEVATASIHTAAIVGDDDTVRRFLALDAGNATAIGGPRRWDALTHLCFSRYLRLDRARSDGFVRAAAALLDAGASANSGWRERDHQPGPVWESVLYGAAGVAHHPELTRLLLARGADPNDDETVYHAPESRDNAALRALVETGRLTEDSLATILLRKADWHDLEAIRWLLERGVDPNLTGRWRWTALHHAIARDNALEIVDLLLDHGADPRLLANGRSAIAIAARRGRADVLASFERRGVGIELSGVDRLIAACARDEPDAIGDLARREPALVGALLAEGGTLLAQFAGTGNAPGVRHLLELGVSASAPYASGDAYYGIPEHSTALHVAAWLARPAIVRLLIARGAPLDVPDANGRTPLALAVRACVDSYWTHRRSPDSVEALLRAGASPRDVGYPSGYSPVDRLLRAD